MYINCVNGDYDAVDSTTKWNKNNEKKKLQSVNAIIVVIETTLFPKRTKRSLILFMFKTRERKHASHCL